MSTWDLHADLYDGETTAGPIPSLYTDNVEEAKSALLAAPARAHADYLKIARIFFMPETVGIEEAVSLVKKPRLIPFARKNN